MSTAAAMPEIHHGDCRQILPTLAADSFDAVITDPPYGLDFMGVAWDTFSAPKGGPRRNDSWDKFGGGASARDKNRAFEDFTRQWAHEAIRVIKPGAHIAAFCGTRTFHRMACAIEDAGFEIRDTLCWLYASGFPKSHDVSKAIDKALGAEREVVGRSENGIAGGSGEFTVGNARTAGFKAEYDITAPATPEAARWSGWGTALKPAVELICLARKPLSEKTVAENVLRHGCGAINVDACRVGTEHRINQPGSTRPRVAMGGGWREDAAPTEASGRWPPNVMHDGSDEVEAAFAAYETHSAGAARAEPGGGKYTGETGIGFAKGGSGIGVGLKGFRIGDSGTASRFFFTAKAGRAERSKSTHPTVKPVSLMRWLCHLLLPPGGIVLDPFAGSGTTLQAATECGFRSVGIEREQEYVTDIKRRLGNTNPSLFLTVPP